MMDRETIATYSKRAAEYDAIAFNDTLKEAMEAFTALLPKGGHIYDLGCGPGQQGAHFVGLGFEVSGLDATPEFVEAAKGRGIAAKLGTFDDLTEIECYDGLWASFSLLHAPLADFPRYLEAAVAALKPKGALFLGMKVGAGEDRDGIGRLYAYHSAENLRQAIVALGLEIVHFEEGVEKGLAGTMDPFVLIVGSKG